MRSSVREKILTSLLFARIVPALITESATRNREPDLIQGANYHQVTGGPFLPEPVR